MATDAERAVQRQKWARAIADGKRAQRANRWRRAQPRAKAGMVRVQPRKEQQ